MLWYRNSVNLVRNRRFDSSGGRASLGDDRNQTMHSREGKLPRPRAPAGGMNIRPTPHASVSTMRVQLFRLKPNRISLIRNKKMGAADAVACQPSAPFPRSALLVFSVVATPLVITQDNEGRLNFSHLAVTTPHARQLTDPFRPTWRTPLVNHSPTSGIGNAESRRASHGRKSLRSATLSDWWPPK